MSKITHLEKKKLEVWDWPSIWRNYSAINVIFFVSLEMATVLNLVLVHILNL